MASYLDPSTVASYEEPWAGGMRRGYLESAANLAGQPRPIPVQQVAGLDPMEMRAREMAGGLGGFSPYIQQGGQMMQQGANYFTPGGIQQFYNPYEQDVVQQTMRDMGEANQRQGIKDRAGAISQGAFGGSRGRLMEQERERSFGRGMMEGIGGIRSQGFGQAMQGAQAAGQGLGTMGRAFGDLGMTGQRGLMGQMGAFNRMGETGRGIQDRMYGAQYGAANRMAQEPWDRMQAWGSMMQPMMPKTGAATTYKANAGTNPFMGLLSLLMGGGG
jgi:hypothetical protein